MTFLRAGALVVLSYSILLCGMQAVFRSICCCSVVVVVASISSVNVSEAIGPVRCKFSPMVRHRTTLQKGLYVYIAMHETIFEDRSCIHDKSTGRIVLESAELVPGMNRLALEFVTV